MNVDRPDPATPGENVLHQALDATDKDMSGPHGQTTETLTDSPSTLPRRIGQYHIKRVIASGGMGTVYEATQEKPRRAVALKLMKHGIASRSALRRFEYESQILARLRHPGIAQVFDADTHKDDTGTTPYFAMEYIPNALPITKFANEKKLGTRQRMELFAQVCDAVHHGHQKGIIHRDLKPSNILVDSNGQVKIIDFGVARSTDSDLAVTTLQTDVGQLIGTLQYMSPEQCQADPHDIDTRSDVYALGVVFYELLCHRLPYDVTRVAMHEATRIIREEQPTKLTTINKTLRGDIETIALKALEKERDRRYQSATDFGQDIHRYLNNEAITARRASVLYQFRVLVRRNKPIFAAIAVVFVVLVSGVIVSTSLYLRSESNRVIAENEAAKAHTTLEFLEGMFDSISPDRGTAGDIKSMLDEAAAKLESGALVEKPEIDAAIRHILGSTYHALTHPDAAEPHLARALDIRRQLLGPEHPDTLQAAAHYARLISGRGRLEEAETLCRQIFQTRSRVLGPEHPDTLWSAQWLATVHWQRGENLEAEAIIRPTLEAQRRILGPEHPHTLWSAWRLASVLAKLGNVDEAERMHREVLASRRRTLGHEHTATIWSMNNLGDLLVGRGKLAEAERIFREGLEICRRRFGDKHNTTLFMFYNLTWVLIKRGKFDEADRLSKQVLELYLDVYGERQRDTLDSMSNRARAHSALGRLIEAEHLFRKVLELRREVLGEEHPQTKSSLGDLAQVLVKQGRKDEARPYVTELITHRKRTAEQPNASPNALNDYASLLLTCELEDLRNPQAALPFARRAVEMGDGKNAVMLDTLALAYFMTGDAAKAVETQEKAISLLPAEELPFRSELETNLAKYHAALSEQESAEPTDQTRPATKESTDAG